MRDRSSPSLFHPKVETLEAREVPAATPLDAMYIVHSAQGDMQELFIGLAAMQHATTPAGREFGRILAQDHYAAFLKLVPLAAAEGVTLQWLTQDQLDNVSHFNHVSGPQFDRDLASFMVQDHQQDIALTSTVASTTTDPMIRANALQNIPVLQFHYQIATIENQAFNHGEEGYTGS